MFLLVFAERGAGGEQLGTGKKNVETAVKGSNVLTWAEKNARRQFSQTAEKNHGRGGEVGLKLGKKMGEIEGRRENKSLLELDL